MSYYRDDDPRNEIIFQMMGEIDDLISKIAYVMDEYACDIDDGYHWVRVPIKEEEE